MQEIQRILVDIVAAESDGYEIIGHPVRIGDVIDWFDKGLEIFLDVNNDEGHDIYKDIIALWGNKRLPIDEQDESCIDYVYSLIQN